MRDNDAPEKLSPLRLSRRDALKAAVLLGAAALFMPVERLAQYLLPQVETGPITYPRQRIANMKDVPANDSILFEYPHKDRPAMLIHLPDGGFAAFDALCTHLGCQIHYDRVAVVGWENNPQQTFCACHGGVFDPKTGSVLGGPPPRPQPKIKLEIDDQGEIFANGYESGLPLYGEA
jgi:nitrite reductase/ring-hydroxylating ferredoxin subunit